MKKRKLLFSLAIKDFVVTEVVLSSSLKQKPSAATKSLTAFQYVNVQ